MALGNAGEWSNAKVRAKTKAPFYVLQACYVPRLFSVPKVNLGPPWGVFARDASLIFFWIFGAKQKTTRVECPQTPMNGRADSNKTQTYSASNLSAKPGDCWACIADTANVTPRRLFF